MSDAFKLHPVWGDDCAPRFKLHDEEAQQIEEIYDKIIAEREELHNRLFRQESEIAALEFRCKKAEESAARRCAEIAMECSANIEQWWGLLCIAQAQVPASDAVDAIKRTSKAIAAAIRAEFGIGEEG